MPFNWAFLRGTRFAHKAQGALLFILEHTEHRCNYCKEILGDGLNVPVADIVKHMKEKHIEKINLKDAELYIRAFS